MKHSLQILTSLVIGVQILLGSATFIPSISIIQSAHAEEKAKLLYTCPMHPEVRSDHPGKCPICGMDLVPLENGGGHEHGMTTMPSTTPITPTVRIPGEKQ